MNYKVDSSGNVQLRGVWDTAMQPSNSDKGKSFTPKYNFFYNYNYNYEYGDV